jgi:lysophospholipase L1-like esterase/peptidoglycan hydrolase-like protein with peptidoglycan-binding domain
MKSLLKYVLSFLIISSFILTPLSSQYTQAFSFGDLFDGDTWGDWFGEGDGGSDLNECITKPLDELEEAAKESSGGTFKYNTTGVHGVLSEQKKKEQLCIALKNNADGEGAESNSPSENFLWKPVSESDSKAVTLLPTSLRGLVLRTDVFKKENGEKLDSGRFSGDEHNGMRPHYRFPKPGSSYGGPIQVIASVAEGIWIWDIKDAAKRADGVKGKFSTWAEVAAWEAAQAAKNQQGTSPDGGGNNISSCPAGQTDTNTDKSVRVMAMGDSNTAGTESSNSLAYRKAFKENMLAKGYTVDMVGSQSSGTGLSDNQHEGYGGRGIAHLQSIASGSSLTTYNPNVILLLVGSNDMWISLDNRTPISDSAANSKVTALGTLLDTIHTKLPNAKIVIAKPATPSTGSVAATRPLGIYKTGISTLASTRSYVSVVDFTGFGNDGVHYTTAGYSSIAETFANKVDEITRKCTGATTTATSTPATSKKLSIECKVSDTTPAVDEDVDIWLEVSGGTLPYDGTWSGDYKKATDFDKDKSDQTVSFKKKGNYKIKIKMTDKLETKAEDTCPTIKVTDDGVDDEVIVRVNTATTATTGTTVQEEMPPSTYPYSRDLTVGATGQDVSALQQYLVARGYLVMPAGVAYGYFGEVTRAAVVRWQIAMGVSPAAGYFGARSRAAMGGYAAPVSAPVAAPVVTTSSQSNTVAQNSCVNITSPVYFGEQSQNVTAVQQFLVRGGYLVMPEGTDYGYYGKSTVTALSKFMTVRGISHQGAIMDAKVLSEIKAVSCL